LIVRDRAVRPWRQADRAAAVGVLELRIAAGRSVGWAVCWSCGCNRPSRTC